MTQQPDNPGTEAGNMMRVLRRMKGLGLPPQALRRIARELEHRRRAEQALRDSEARLRAIVATAVDGIITIDERGIIESANPAALRLFGYAEGELVGQNLKILMPSPDRQQHDGYIANYVHTGHRKIIGIGREVMAQRKDGSLFPADLAVSEVVLGDRRLFTGIVRDITERKAAEASLRAAKAAAESADQAKDQFLAVLSHELRTPLTPIMATIAHVQTRPDLPAELREELGTIRRNLDLEVRLIDDLLDLTRIRRGKVSLHTQPADAHLLLRAALEVCQNDIAAGGLEVSMSLRAAEYTVFADPARLQQVFWNLLKNAVKFTPRGGRIALRSWNPEAQSEIPDLKSEISNSESAAPPPASPPLGASAPPRSTSSQPLIIEISDTGIGIEPEVLPHIFAAFEQGEREVTRRFGGLGLGLTISKALVERHGGALRAASEGRGKGATFTVELPTTQTQPLPREDRAPSTPAAAGDKNTRILLVEDHADTLRIMSRLLRGYGYSVAGASSISAALDLARRQPFDLLITDIGLPDGSGWDLLRGVRAHQQIPAIAVSGFGTENDHDQSREAGFAAHLTKPIDVGKLNEAILRIRA